MSMEETQGGRWLADDCPRPEEQTLRQEKGLAVRRMLGQLPPQYRLVIVLRYWYDLSYDEIAQITQCTQSAIKSRLHRARRMMADKIEECHRAVECVSVTPG